MTTSTCRFCKAPLEQVVVDLGMSPLCETFLTADQLSHMEPFYPLRVFVCEECWLVQLEEFVSPDEIFGFYPYFSSYSDSWLRHAERYTKLMIDKLGLTSESLVVELGSNDGYLLQYFAGAGIGVLGIEPAENVAEAAREKGIPTRSVFFGTETAASLLDEGLLADLVVGNNVLAQVPDLNGFVTGIQMLLGPKGVATIEVPHLMRLVDENQYDTIYHEHFSYFSLITVERIAEKHGLEVFDVQELPSHGGSLRLFFQQSGAGRALEDAVGELREREQSAGLDTTEYYAAFESRVRASKRALLSYLIAARGNGETVVGYGAPGKGNTLLNYCGIREDLLSYTVDRNPLKQGRFLPGTHIPIKHPDSIRETKPDAVLILPWNLKNEIVEQMSFVRSWGGRFVVPIPEVQVL
jgi:SAM-dependent methyltransferase